MGLVLSIKHDESLIIGDDIVISFKSSKRKPINLRVHIDAPKHLKVARQETVDNAPEKPAPVRKPVRRMIAVKPAK